jgi:2-deoxy-D-gluconate 3-dehydrogenase
VDQFRLDGRVALVTGGNGGLGRAMALALEASGAVVAVTGRDEGRNAAIAAELAGGRAAVHELDVREEDAVRETIAAVVARHGRLDILVNNAGIVDPGAAIDKDPREWDAALATDLTGPFHCSRHAAGAMIAGGEGGKIINIGSIYSLLATPSYAAYGAAKAGLLGLTRALAVELAPHGIQVNAILPGWFETTMTSGMDADRAKRITDRTPAGRWGHPDDLGGAVVFLASAASNFVTGTTLVVDGGFSISVG